MSQKPFKLSRSLRRVQRRLTFIALRSLVRGLGFARLRPLGRLLGDMQYLAGGRERRRWQREIAVLLGLPPDDARAARLLREAYRTNTSAVLEILAMFDRKQDLELLRSRVQVEGLDELRTALAGGRGAILLAGHSGNGALLVVWLVAAGIPVSVVHKESRMMDAGFFMNGLPQYGIDGILANEGIKAYSRMLGALRAGGAVYVMADQGTKRKADGLPMRFLGKDMTMPPGPAQLARHAKAPVLPVTTVAADPCWRFVIEPPVVLEKGQSLEADTEALLRVTERQILEYPQLWSWQQRRWRKHPLA